MVAPQDVRETASACRHAPVDPAAALRAGRPVAAGLGMGVDPSRELCARVLERLFPWAPSDTDPWAALRWANGRAPLGERPRLAPDWVAHPAPLQQWDGEDPTRPACGP